jgi:hypothetical protein
VREWPCTSPATAAHRVPAATFKKQLRNCPLSQVSSKTNDRLCGWPTCLDSSRTPRTGVPNQRTLGLAMTGLTGWNNLAEQKTNFWRKTPRTHSPALSIWTCCLPLACRSSSRPRQISQADVAAAHAAAHLMDVLRPNLHQQDHDNYGRKKNAISDGNSVIGHAPLPVCSQSWRRAFAVAIVTSSFLPEKSRRGPRKGR